MSQLYIKTDIENRNFKIEDADFIRMIEYMKPTKSKSFEIVKGDTIYKLTFAGSNKDGTESKLKNIELTITDIDEEKPNGEPYEVEDIKIYKGGEQLATDEEMELIEALKYYAEDKDVRLEVKLYPLDK